MVNCPLNTEYSILMSFALDFIKTSSFFCKQRLAALLRSTKLPEGWSLKGGSSPRLLDKVRSHFGGISAKKISFSFFLFFF